MGYLSVVWWFNYTGNKRAVGVNTIDDGLRSIQLTAFTSNMEFDLFLYAEKVFLSGLPVEWWCIVQEIWSCWKLENIYIWFLCVVSCLNVYSLLGHIDVKYRQLFGKFETVLTIFDLWLIQWATELHGVSHSMFHKIDHSATSSNVIGMMIV